jgi:anti-sigma factor RsiW
MAERDIHPIEAIHMLVDDRLDAAEREALERHLATCASCREERDVAAATVRLVRVGMPDPELPPGLATRLDAALDEIDRAAEPRASRSWSWLAPLGAALLAVVALLVLLPFGDDEPPVGERIVASLSSDFAAVQAGSLPLELPEADPAALEAFFVDRGIDFETRVFDLSMMGFDIAGGRVEALAGRTAALFAYRGPDGVLMVCRMYLGTLEELPEPARTLENDGIVFWMYERDGRTMVFWEEGDVVCVLTSDAPAQAVIDLSFAKAVKV